METEIEAICIDQTSIESFDKSIEIAANTLKICSSDIPIVNIYKPFIRKIFDIVNVELDRYNEIVCIECDNFSLTIYGNDHFRLTVNFPSSDTLKITSPVCIKNVSYRCELEEYIRNKINSFLYATMCNSSKYLVDNGGFRPFHLYLDYDGSISIKLCPNLIPITSDSKHVIPQWSCGYTNKTVEIYFPPPERDPIFRAKKSFVRPTVTLENKPTEKDLLLIEKLVKDYNPIIVGNIPQEFANSIIAVSIGPTIKKLSGVTILNHASGEKVEDDDMI